MLFLEARETFLSGLAGEKRVAECVRISAKSRPLFRKPMETIEALTDMWGLNSAILGNVKDGFHH
jgi:hypothetical protein